MKNPKSVQARLTSSAASFSDCRRLTRGTYGKQLGLSKIAHMSELLSFTRGYARGVNTLNPEDLAHRSKIQVLRNDTLLFS